MHVVRRNPDVGYYSSALWLPKSKVNVESVRRALTVPLKRGKGVETYVFAWKETSDHLIVPRRFFNLEDFREMFPIYDVRPKTYAVTGITSKIQLDAMYPHLSYQKESVSRLVESEGGILQLSCGKGKTIIALEAAVRIGGPTLIVVDNTQLLGQWVGEIERWLEVPGGVGVVRGKQQDAWSKNLVLTTYATLAAYADELPPDVLTKFSTVIFEEAHHLGADTYIRAAGLFPGRRYGLTATPERADGATRLYTSFLGPILYKDLKTELEPRVVFLETGVSLNLSDTEEMKEVIDSAKELHYGLLCAALGRKKARLELAMKQIKDAEAAGREILVLSHSKVELLNLYGMYSGETTLFSDIPRPTPQELNLPTPPCMMSPRRIIHQKKNRGKLFQLLQTVSPERRKEVQFSLAQVELEFAAHESYLAIERAYEKRQVDFLKGIIARNMAGRAGLLIADVPLAARMQMLATRKVIFGIMRYGKEALNKRSLDSILVLNPIAQDGGLYQILGRALRSSAGKRPPVAMFLEDNIGIVRGMCKKLRSYLRDRKVEDGGPVKYFTRVPAKESVWAEFQ
jgi:hypothetical protein